MKFIPRTLLVWSCNLYIPIYMKCNFFCIQFTNMTKEKLLSFFSARMMWIGPHCKHNRPEARNYSFWIKNSDDNNFLREQGIRCLADHEIGTHFVSFINVKLYLSPMSHYCFYLLWMQVSALMHYAGVSYAHLCTVFTYSHIDYHSPPLSAIWINSNLA